MLFNEIYLKKQKRNYVRNEARRMFNVLLSTHAGTNFKKNVPLDELIDSKIDNEEERFKFYVGFIDNIIQYSKILFNINLTTKEITIKSTANAIIDLIEKKYMNL